MISREFDATEGILHVRTEGRISAAEMLESLKKVSEHISDIPVLLVLEDATNASAFFSVSEVFTIMNHLEEVLTHAGEIKHAVVHTDPVATALAVLASRINWIKKYRISVFSTPEAAREWLLTEKS
jgi:predicted TIM-barrel fold metal-dependent hydrolase